MTGAAAMAAGTVIAGIVIATAAAETAGTAAASARGATCRPPSPMRNLMRWHHNPSPAARVKACVTAAIPALPEARLAAVRIWTGATVRAAIPPA